jgi:hypothetical protein
VIRLDLRRRVWSDDDYRQLIRFAWVCRRRRPERTVAETISPPSDWVEIGGVRKLVISYLGDFLFAPQRVGSAVKMLSGDERNRLLLVSHARAFLDNVVTQKESRELDQLPRQIEALEAEQRELAAQMASSEYHKRGAEQMRSDARVTEIERLLEAAFERWADLDGRSNTQR